MANVQPYKIAVPDSALDELKTRLSLARFPDELDAAGWDLGAPLADVKRLTAYWKDEFDWRAAERKLNELPQFTAPVTVEGFEPLNIHFVHKVSSNPNAIPLLFVHGWPGSFIEVVKVLDGLANPPVSSLGDAGGNGVNGDENANGNNNNNKSEHPSFNVVAISLPNFGFSSGPKKRGFALEHYAEVCHKLMTEVLSYPQYVTQGGDWGFYITRAISLLYPRQCKATHLNMDFGTAPSLWSKNFGLALRHSVTPYTAREKAGLARTKWFMDEGSAYRSQQSTKPQTLGYALADSPVALLAWIYEKLNDWTDGPYPWTDDEVCTWISIYQFSTAGAAASVRIYYEVVHDYINNNNPPPPQTAEGDGDGNATSSTSTNINKPETKRTRKITRERVGEWIGHVKIGITHSPRDLRVLPRSWTAQYGDIVFERDHDAGGHFLAWEKPENLLADVRQMFGSLPSSSLSSSRSHGAADARRGGAYGVVDGKSGY